MAFALLSILYLMWTRTMAFIRARIRSHTFVNIDVTSPRRGSRILREGDTTPLTSRMSLKCPRLRRLHPQEHEASDPPPIPSLGLASRLLILLGADPHMILTSVVSAEDLESSSSTPLGLKFQRNDLRSCSVCLEDYQVGESVICSSAPDRCQHLFHHGCMIEWIKASDSVICPMCKRIFVGKESERRAKSPQQEGPPPQQGEGQQPPQTLGLEIEAAREADLQDVPL